MIRILLVWLLVGGGSSSIAYDDCPAVGSVSRLDRAQGAVVEEPPTPSPSPAPVCVSQTSNARGRYSSTMAPCRFTFHSVKDPLESRWIHFETSSLCSSENGFLEIQEYVSNWSDECVGDYSRCYSLEHHRGILFDFLCGIHVELPPETTHLSVDCTEDKELWLEAQERSQSEQHHERRDDKLKTFELKLFNLMLIMACCLGGIFVISKVLVEPLVTQASQTLDTHRECPEGCNSSNEGWIASRRVHLEIDGTPESEDGEARMLEEFERQIPADFDAIPIVPATIVTYDDTP